MRYLFQVSVLILLFVFASDCGPGETDCTKTETCSSGENTTSEQDGGTSTVTERVIKDPSALRWNKVTVPTQEDLWGVAMPSNNKIWVVGGAGVILHSTDFGQTWKAQTSGTTDTLRAVSFINDSMGWAVGDKGTIVHTKNGGETWTKLPSPDTETLWAVQFLNEKLGYAVGDGFSLLRTSTGGALWNPTSRRLDIDLYGLHFFEDKKGYLVGSNGSIFFTDDGALNVTNEPTGTDQHMRGIAYVNGEIWSVGGTGQLLLKKANAGWARPASGVDSGLYGVWFASASRGWAVGKNGLILGTRDAKQWDNEARLTFPDLHGITGRSETNAVIVGAKGTVLILQEVKDECKDGDSRNCYSGPQGTQGVGRCAGGKQTCQKGVWKPCEGEVTPADKEICFNNQDDNCNGKSELEDKCPPCKENERRDCYTGPDGTAGVGVCSKGEQFCRNDKWDVCENQALPTEEKCNGSDDDCDGQVDNGVKNPPNCDQAIGVCATGKKICKGGFWQPCEAAQFGADYQKQEDKCDGKDNDCDGAVDEGCACSKDGESKDCYGGLASTEGKGECKKGAQTCTSGKWTDCVGQVVSVEEVCEDKKDNDCDGEVDEKTQYALQCNGNWSYASIPASQDFQLATFTIEGWFKLSDFPSRGGSMTLVSMMQGGGFALTLSSRRLGPGSGGGDNLNFYFWPKGAQLFASVAVKTADNLKKDTWHHIAGTYDGKTAALWVDGKKVKEETRADPIVYTRNNVPLIFGAEAGEGGIDQRNGAHLEGSIAQVRLSSKVVYDSSFTPDCILTKTADTVGLWLLEEGKGDTLKDETGKHNGKWNGPGWDNAPRCPGFSKGGGCKNP